MRTILGNVRFCEEVIFWYVEEGSLRTQFTGLKHQKIETHEIDLGECYLAMSQLECLENACTLRDGK